MQVSGEKKMNLLRIKKNKALSKCSFFSFLFVVNHPSSRIQGNRDKGPETRCNTARNIARNIRHSTWLHGSQHFVQHYA